MAVITSKPRHRVLKRSLIVSGVLAALLLVVHLLFVNKAREIFKQYIAVQSHGKIKIELSQLDLNLWSNRMQIHEAELLSTDSLNDPVTYHVSFSTVTVKVGSIWDLVVHKKLLLDSLKLYNPVIQVIQWRKDTTRSVQKDELSIPQEMGKVYNSLLDALDEFAVRRIIIDNATISLIDKMRAGAEPVTVSKIFFDLARTPVKNGNRITYQNKEETIELKTSNQDIALPGGRYNISFRSFRLRLLRQSIELDSCIVTAKPTDSLKSNYRVFFKKLLLNGVDFPALSAENVIKADTVYCDNPFFDLNLYQSDAIEKKTQLPDPNKIIRELTGNLNLAFVGVKQAGIHFDIYGKTKRSFFNSNKDNFEIRGFRVTPDSLQPVSITRFNMTLRDYHLFNEDSSSTFGFDSLHLLNNRIVLNNFAIATSSSRTRVRNLLDIKIPYFELSELDWYQLIFEQNLVAREAVLSNPVINFTRKKSGTPGKKFDLFATLLNLDSLVALDNVSVTNGKVSGRLGAATLFNVQNIDFNVYSNRLLRSTNKEALRRAVEHLAFSKGELRLKDITLRAEHARYTGNNLIHADKIAISGREKKIEATVHNVSIDNLQLDDNADTIEVDGVQWDSANIDLRALPYSKDGKSSSIRLRKISGNNTSLHFSNGPTVVSTHLQTLQASSLLKEENNPIRVEGLLVTGNDLLVSSKAVKLSAASYRLSGTDSSALNDFNLLRATGPDTIDVRSPLVSFAADLNRIFADDLHLRYVHATSPLIHVAKGSNPAGEGEPVAVLSTIRIDELLALEADITVSTRRRDSVTTIRVPSSENGIIHASGITVSGEGLKIDSALLQATAATLLKPGGEMIGVEHGNITMQLSAIELGKKDGNMHWSGLVRNLEVDDDKGLHMGTPGNNLLIPQASLGHLYMSSDFLPGFRQLLKANDSAWLQIPSATFIDSKKTLRWYNVRYDNNTKTLNLDSFVYHPTKSLEAVLAVAPYQLDYIRLKTGPVALNGLDLESFQQDSSIVASGIEIDQPVLTVYRDKQPPYSPIRKSKPLPVDLVKQLSFPVSVGSIQVRNGSITYSEKNGKSRKQGDVLLTDVSAALENIKNRDLVDQDSLSLDFRATLMNAAPFAVNLKESYHDSLSGFLLEAKVRSAALSNFNPILVPLLNVKTMSGLLDSALVTAVGSRDFAKGEMKMHYRGFRIRLVKGGVESKSTFVQHITSFLGNTFVLKRNNTKRIGVIFSKHTKEQSFINYVVQTTLSGVMSSIGMAKNRKYIQQYNRMLEEAKIPASGR